MTTSFIEEIETKELIQKLIDNGFEREVIAFTIYENKVFTKKGRPNKSGACRTLDYKPKELENRFKLMKELLRKDLDIPEDEEKN